MIEAGEKFIQMWKDSGEEFISNAVFEGQKQLEKWTNEITNNSAISSVVNNNRNVQQPVTIQVGDIHLAGVQNVNGLAHEIITRLPGQMQQEYFKR